VSRSSRRPEDASTGASVEDDLLESLSAGDSLRAWPLDSEFSRFRDLKESISIVLGLDSQALEEHIP
jgi:hypothetical protein